jgi:hypothetical protein
MTETIGLGSMVRAAGGAVPARYFDKAGREVSPSQWEALWDDDAYRQLRITNVTGLTAAGRPVWIRIHTIWIGIGAVCGPPCSKRHLFETRVFDYFDYLAGLEGWNYDLTIPWPWGDVEEAVQGHDAMAREIVQCVPQGRAQLDENLAPTLDLRELYAQRFGRR